MEKIEDGAPRKDNNFTLENMKLKISKEDFRHITNIIYNDCEFLKEHKIIDYSLLVGIYEKEKALSKHFFNYYFMLLIMIYRGILWFSW